MVAFPVMDAICFPVRACVLMMRLEATSSAVVCLSLIPGMPPVGGVREGREEGGGEETTGGMVRTPEEGTERGC